MKKRGLRNCYALGGILDADDPFAPDPKADLLSRGQDMIDSTRRNSGLSGRQRLAAMGSVGGSMTALGGTPDYGMTLPGGISARQRANFGALAFGQDVNRMRRRGNDPVDPASPDIGFAEGTLDAAAAAKAQADAIAAKYGISGNTPAPAPAPAPAPVQQAPVQAPPPKPAGFINGIRNMLSPDARMRAAGAADGAVGVGSPEWRPPLPPPKPIATPTDGNGIRGVRGGVAPDGTIRGPGTPQSDSIPASVGDTEFNVANGEKLAILPAKVAKNPEALNQIEEIIEGETGKPVNRGLRSGAGYAPGMLPEVYNPVRGQAGAPYSDVRDPSYSPPRSTTPVQDGVTTGQARPGNSGPDWQYRPPAVVQSTGPIDGEFARVPTPRPAPVAGSNSSPEAAALRERLSSPEGNTIRSNMANAVNTNGTASGRPRVYQQVEMSPASAVQNSFQRPPAVQPAIQPAQAAATIAAQPDMLPPDSVTPTAKPTQPQGIGARVQQFVGDARAKLSGIPGTSAADAAAKATKAPTPITDFAQRAGKAYAQDGIAGVAKNAAGGVENKLNTKTGRVGTAIGAGLQIGDHFDAFNDDSGLSHAEKAQLLLRDAGVVGGGAIGAVAGGTAGSVVPVAGTLAGGVAGGVGGAIGADKAMGGIRRSLNWANEQLGGAPNYWEDSDALIKRSREHQQADPDYKEGPVQKGARGINSAIGGILEKTGLITRDPGAAKPSAEEQRIRKANDDVLNGTQKAADQKALDDLKAKTVAGKAAANPNVAALRSAGVQGDVGAQAEWKQDGAGRSYQSTPARGIRQIATSNGDVYAGRDAKGQLNVTSNVGQTPAEDEAARSKEATRLTADLARQKDYFANRAIESDLNSNSPTDRARGLAAQAKRAQDQTTALNGRKLDIDARGQDMQLLGHQLDTQAKMATLQNTRQQQNLENNTKLIDSLMGGQTIKGPDGKDMPNTEREAFLMKLTKTLGEGGKTIGHMAPQDFVSFHNAYQADKRSKGNTFEQLYKNWIDGNPEVDDYNPYRNIERAAGDAGKSNALKYYRDRNGVLRNERDVTGRQFLNGSYDANIKRQIDNR